MSLTRFISALLTVSAASAAGLRLSGNFCAYKDSKCSEMIGASCKKIAFPDCLELPAPFNENYGTVSANLTTLIFTFKPFADSQCKVAKKTSIAARSGRMQQCVGPILSNDENETVYYKIQNFTTGAVPIRPIKPTIIPYVPSNFSGIFKPTVTRSIDISPISAIPLSLIVQPSATVMPMVCKPSATRTIYLPDTTHTTTILVPVTITNTVVVPKVTITETVFVPKVTITATDCVPTKSTQVVGSVSATATKVVGSVSATATKVVGSVSATATKVVGSVSVTATKVGSSLSMTTTTESTVEIISIPTAIIKEMDEGQNREVIVPTDTTDVEGVKAEIIGSVATETQEAKSTTHYTNKLEQ